MTLTIALTAKQVKLTRKSKTAVTGDCGGGERTNRMNWIDVETALPKTGNHVIICTGDGVSCEAYLDNKGRWCSEGGILNDVCYWMPFPKAAHTKSKILDRAIHELDELKKASPKLEIIIDLPDNKGGHVKISNIQFYENSYGELVIDGE